KFAFPPVGEAVPIRIDRGQGNAKVQSVSGRASSLPHIKSGTRRTKDLGFLPINCDPKVGLRFVGGAKRNATRRIVEAKPKRLMRNTQAVGEFPFQQWE